MHYNSRFEIASAPLMNPVRMAAFRPMADIGSLAYSPRQIFAGSPSPAPNRCVSQAFGMKRLS